MKSLEKEKIRTLYRETRDELWDYMLSHDIATEEEMILVTYINGFRLDVLESILYARTGYDNLKEYKEFN